MKKEPTEKQLAQRQKFAEAARARSAAAKQKISEPVVEPEPTEPEVKPEEISTEVNVSDLMRQIKEIQETNALLRAAVLNQQTGPQVTARGMIGTFEKYIIDPDHYPSPTERLARESRLAQFAFPINYELTFEVTTTEYQTKDGINTKEPRFTVELNKIMLDEDGVETDGRYTIRRMILHEDPQAALVIAREQGLEVDESNEKAFLDEMRYIRIRDWLLEAFYRPRDTSTKKNKREMVVDGKIVQYFEINSVSSSGVPFNELDKNKKMRI